MDYDVTMVKNEVIGLERRDTTKYCSRTSVSISNLNKFYISCEIAY
jgi:hypothetical protein